MDAEPAKVKVNILKEWNIYKFNSLGYLSIQAL